MGNVCGGIRESACKKSCLDSGVVPVWLFTVTMCCVNNESTNSRTELSSNAGDISLNAYMHMQLHT